MDAQQKKKSIHELNSSLYSSSHDRAKDCLPASSAACGHSSGTSPDKNQNKSYTVYIHDLLASYEL